MPDANIVITGTGADRTLTATPAAGQTGTATVTVTVTDEDGGTVTDTFVVTVIDPSGNTPPVISDVPDQKAVAGSKVTVPVFVADAETPPDKLTVTAASSDPDVIPVNQIQVAGTGFNRTVSFTPAAGQVGTVTITLTVTDANGDTATDTFVVSVADPSTQSAPTISDVADQTTTGGTIGPVQFTVGDAQTPAELLTITVASSNPTLVPVANVGIGGSGANRTLFVTPAAGQTGTATITLTVTDADGQTTSDAFTVTVAAAGDAPTIIAHRRPDDRPGHPGDGQLHRRGRRPRRPPT